VGRQYDFPIADESGIEKAFDPLLSHFSRENKLEEATPGHFGGIPSSLVGNFCSA
jgi:hypothetical protein